MDVTRRLRTQWDWVVGSTLIGVAAVVLVVTWVGVSGSRYVSDELSYIASGGLGGLVLLGLGAVLVTTAGLADEWRKLNRVEDALPFAGPDERTDPAALVRRARVVAAGGMLVAVAFLVPAWVKISGNAQVKPGLGALTWGVVGLVIGGLIAGLATMGVQRRIQRRKRGLFGAWALALDAGADADAGRDAAPVADAGSVLVADELTRFHRPGCPAVTGVATRRVDRRAIPADLEPCELCEADALVREVRAWTSVAG